MRGVVVRRLAVRRLAVLALIGGAALAASYAAACVEIAAGPGGVASIRLEPLPLPPSIVVGDTLRDSTGAVLRLRATAFDQDGKAVADAPFRFVFAPLARDTSAAQRDNKALAVDSLTGLVTAAAGFVVPQGRVGVRLGDQLQLLDTIEIVPRPTRLLRAATANGDSARTLAFSCGDAAIAPIFNQALDTGSVRQNGLATGAVAGNATPLSTLLLGDSATHDSVAVRSYLVRYEILSPTGIKSVPLERGARPAIGIVDGSTDTPLRYDTTNTSGLAEPRLRIYSPGLARADYPRDTILVTVRATALRAPRDTVASPRQFVIRLVRLTKSPTGTALACP